MTGIPMNTKRKYPLFVIDTSRTHGRGRETDYISCTSTELPFVASVNYPRKQGICRLLQP